MGNFDNSRESKNVIDLRKASIKEKRHYSKQVRFDADRKKNANLYEKEKVENWGHNDPSVPNPADVGRDAARVGMASDIGRRIYNNKKNPVPSKFKKDAAFLKHTIKGKT